MRSKLTLSVAVASLLFAAPVFAAETSPAAAPGCQGERKHHGFKRMEHRFDRAVEQGRLTREQADQFAAEARQLREEARAQREASGGQLTPEQKEQFKQRRQALRQKVHAAMKPPAAQGA
jgi:protein CpxP